MSSQSTTGNEVDSTIKVTGYSLRNSEIDPKDGECVVKKSVDTATGRERYWVKFCTMGPDAGHMLNPHSPNFVEGSFGRKAEATGRSKFEFREVNSEAFNLYKLYLKTNNPLNIKGAERAAINGT